MSTSRLFHAVVGVGISLGALSAGCSATTDEEHAEAAEAAQTSHHDPFCEVAWPTTKGGGPRPSAAQACIDPHHECGDYPGMSDAAHASEDATIEFTKDFHVNQSGHATVGAGLRVEYALERLPQCRTDGTDWNVTGFYSENGGPVQSFELTEVTPDGNRVAKAARIVPTGGGDVALWFKASNGAGCEHFDSAFGANFHAAVKENPGSAGDFEWCASKESNGTCGADHQAWLFCTAGAHGPRWTCPHGMVRMSRCDDGKATP